MVDGWQVGRGVEVLERAAGRMGELVLRRTGEDLEVIAGGTFLISSANVASSVAPVTAGMNFLKQVGTLPSADNGGSETGIEVLIGGLGLGYTLDAALADRRIGRAIVAEYEPVIVDWFHRYGAKRSERFTAAEAVARARIVVDDVADVMRANPASFDLIALDTDNGPDWLVREGNGGLYDEAGMALAYDALRPGGVAVFWSPERYDWFAARLAARFCQVNEIAAHDRVGGRTHEYTMYVAQRPAE